MASQRPVRMMNISGSPVDDRTILAQMAASDEPIDIFTGDWMSELNMPSRAHDYTKGLDIGYEPSFLEALEPALEHLARKRTKLAANAGVVATKDLFDKVVELVSHKGLDLTVAWVEGDAVLETITSLRASGTKFQHLSVGTDLNSWDYDPIFAQCYLGGWGIAKALEAGADIVVCGRVADASPTVGAAAWWHGWARTDYDKLAQALMAGHLIECSTYVTGGNFTGFKTRLDWSQIYELGYPIAEVAEDGDVIVTKRDGTGGIVTAETCKEQLLYEIQGKYYLNCDVTAVIDNVCLTEVGKDRVRLSGVKGLPPPKTTKAGLTAHGGYTAEIHWALVGLDIEEKVQMTDIQLRHSFGPERMARFSCFSLQTYGSVPENPRNQNAATVDLRLVVQARERDALSATNFARPALDRIMAGFPAATFHPDKRSTTPMAFQEYFPTLIPQPTVTVHLSQPEQPALVIPPPSEAAELPQQLTSYDTQTPVALDSFGPVTRAPFGHVVLGRAGDKGSNCNVGFFVSDETQWPWLRSFLSKAKFVELMDEEYQGQSIDRMEFPHLWAVHFLIHDHLDRGVTANATYDVLGKFICEFIRTKPVDIPSAFLQNGRV